MKYFAPGFASPTGAQACFRGILQAISTPGMVVPLTRPVGPPPGLSAAAASVLLTLVDSSVSASLPAGDDAARDWLVFHAGVQLAAPGTEDFVLARAHFDLRQLRKGTDDAPEDGATLVLDVASLETGRLYRLTGPGIETERRVMLPLADGFLEAWRQQAQTAPRGVDVILCHEARILGLPRSLKIEEI
jgi:alpha-D-ribose 1-methylphosphonate 5-triphosphate synthase subunit PhnH